MVRFIALIRTPALKNIDKQEILEHLNIDDFKDNWDNAAKLYIRAINYLKNQKFIVSQSIIPYENMIIPVMMFLNEISDDSQINERQREFISWWYWSSIFSTRYSRATNDIIKLDAESLKKVGGKIKINASYFIKFRCVINEPDDLFNYTRPSGAVYKGIHSLMHQNSKNGLLDWMSTQRASTSSRLEDHHIFPRNYIETAKDLDIDKKLAKDYMDSIVNRALMPKLVNIKVSNKSPYQYLNELSEHNPGIEKSIESHMIPKMLLEDETWSQRFKEFLDIRAESIYKMINKRVNDPIEDIRNIWSDNN